MSSSLTEDLSAVSDLTTSLVRTTPTGITSDELMVDPSNLHGHQGNNDIFVLSRDGDNFQLFRSHDDITFIFGKDDTASYWGGGKQTIYDYGSGATLRFSELQQAQIKIYGLENDPTATIDLYNTPSASWATTLTPDGHGGTMLGNIDFVGDPNVSPSQIHYFNSETSLANGGLVPVA